jgi:hypothetical protein
MQTKLVLLNRDGDIAARGDTLEHLVYELQTKGLVRVDTDGFYWEWKKPLSKQMYGKKEDEYIVGSGFELSEFILESSYDIVKHACSRLGYNLYRRDPYM